jgi:class 3 adenylate cyclase
VRATGSEREIHRVFRIADVAVYTALTEEMGAAEAARVVSRYRALTEAALHPDAKVIERVGDEVLVAADAAVAVMQTALALREAIEVEPLFTSALRRHSGRVLF